MIRVSIIMGIYNCEETLGKSIDSVISQTYTDWELIMCDDGSKDGTYELAKKYADKYTHIHVIKNEKNCGLAYSLNRASKLAKGEYIARLDGDDYCLPDRFMKQVNFLDKHKEYAIVGSNMLLFNEHGVWGRRVMKEYPDTNSFLLRSPFAHPTIMMRRQCLEKVNGYRVHKETKRCEDFDLFARLYAEGYKGCNLQEPLYGFREDQGAYKRRAYKYRIDEARVRYKCFKRLGLLPKGLIYVLKPLIVGLVPQSILAKLRNESM